MPRTWHARDMTGIRPARSHFAELAHADALQAELPQPPHYDCPAEVYASWSALRDQTAAWVSAEEAVVASLLCRKCTGTGTTRFKHRCGGVCFSCNGYGWSAKGRKFISNKLSV